MVIYIWKKSKHYTLTYFLFKLSDKFIFKKTALHVQVKVGYMYILRDVYVCFVIYM